VAYDEKLADRVRSALARRKRITEKKMFGGLAFMLKGRMCCGVLNDDLVVRIGPEHYAAALTPPACPADGLHRPSDLRIRLRRPGRGEGRYGSGEMATPGR